MSLLLPHATLFNPQVCVVLPMLLLVVYMRNSCEKKYDEPQTSVAFLIIPKNPILDALKCNIRPEHLFIA